MLLNEDQIALRDVARRFSREKLKPHYQAREAEKGFDRALMKEIGALGLIGVDLPEEYGGLGQSGVTSGLITEEIAYGDFNISYLQLLGSLMGAIVHRNANPELARYWNSRLVAGDAIIGLGLTEPRGGSDAANLQVKARRDGNHYILSGEKTSISFSDQCDAIVLFARTGKPDAGARGISAFLVPMDAPGIQRTRFNDVGSKIVGRGSVFFDNVKIPANHRMGEENRAFFQIMNGFDYSRALIGLQCLAAAQASLDESWEYIKERKAFGASALLEPLLYWLDNIGNMLTLTAQTFFWAVRPPYRLSQLLGAMEFIGVQSIFIVGLTGVFSGMVFTLQVAYALRNFGAEGQVGGIVAIALLRELAPVFTAIMVTARAGSAMAAELGNMRVTEQIDAITTMGVSPVQYLLAPRLFASVVMLPLLCALYSSVGMGGSYLVAVLWLGGDFGIWMQSGRDLAVPKDLTMGLIKSTVFGFILTAISCRHGYFASGGAKGVGLATTRAVVESCVAILIVNYILTQFMIDLQM